MDPWLHTERFNGGCYRKVMFYFGVRSVSLWCDFWFADDSAKASPPWMNTMWTLWNILACTDVTLARGRDDPLWRQVSITKEHSKVDYELFLSVTLQPADIWEAGVPCKMCDHGCLTEEKRSPPFADHICSRRLMCSCSDWAECFDARFFSILT